VRHFLREPAIAAGAAAAIAPPAVLHFFGGKQVMFGGWTHFLLRSR
jgi:hypothetical protein